MRSLFWALFLLAIATMLALLVQFNQSNVVLFYPPYRVDLSLNFFLLLQVIGWIFCYFFVRMIHHLFTLPKRARQYRHHQRQRHAGLALCEAYTNLSAGRFSRAEKMAQATRVYSDYAQVGALIGARCAHYLHQPARRDSWLKQITASELQQARDVSLAEMQVESRDAHGALNTIAQLHAQGGRQIKVQHLALRAHQQLKNWSEVLRLARSLEKHNALHPAAIRGIKQQACHHLLKEHRNNAHALLTLWHTFSAAERRLTGNARLAAYLFIELEHPSTAQELLEEALEHTWDSQLLFPYAECVSPTHSARPLIAKIESWLSLYPREAILHYALGRLCMHQKLWGKAQASFEDCLIYAEDNQTIRHRAHIALGKLNESLERNTLAYEHYRASALTTPADRWEK
ncbi:MAG: heme biosynthesis protein HemY [Ottowia sp.]|nr:heme biosynthesis protein HemY [Ottowia sp.]